MRLRLIVICGLSGSVIFCFHFILQNARISEKVIEHKIVCFDFLYNFCLKIF